MKLKIQFAMIDVQGIGSEHVGKKEIIIWKAWSY